MAPRKSTPVMHVALLRGINVETAKRVAMADLRALCEALGYGHVKTLLNTGNVIFSAPLADARAAAKIKKEIASQSWGAERLGIGSRATYLWCPNGIIESKAVVALGKALSDTVPSLR